MIFPNPTDQRIIGTQDMGSFTADADGSLGEKLQNILEALAGQVSIVVQEAGQTISSETAMQNTELTFPVAANEVWQFEGVLLLDIPAAADIKVAATGPTGAVGSIAGVYHDASGGSDAGAAALGTSFSAISGADGRILRFWGGIHNGANAGSLTVQFAQNSSTATNTSVLAGSYIKYQRES